MRATHGLAALALLTAAAQAGIASRLDRNTALESDAQHPQVPTVPTALLYGLLRPRLAADLQFARAASYAGDARFSAGRPALAPLVNLAVALDPGFMAAYRLGGLLLAAEPQGERAGVQLLLDGARRFDTDFTMPFYAGCVQLTALSDAEGASTSWRMAARRPGAPAFLESLVSRLRGRSGRCFVALLAIRELQRSTPASSGQGLVRRETLLHLECALLEIEDAVASYRAAHGGEPPRRLEDLLGPGLLPRIPPEPLRGQWILGPDGSVRSSSGMPRISLGEVKETVP